jgi:hypothetical protein
MHSQDLGGDRMRGPGSGLPLPPPAAPPTGRPPPTAFTDESERRGRESRLSSDGGGGGGGPRTCWMLVAGEGVTEEGRHRGEGERWVIGVENGGGRGSDPLEFARVTPPTTGARGRICLTAYVEWWGHGPTAGIACLGKEM